MRIADRSSRLMLRRIRVCDRSRNRGLAEFGHIGSRCAALLASSVREPAAYGDRTNEFSLADLSPQDSGCSLLRARRRKRLGQCRLAITTRFSGDAGIVVVVTTRTVRVGVVRLLGPRAFVGVVRVAVRGISPTVVRPAAARLARPVPAAIARVATSGILEPVAQVPTSTAHRSTRRTHVRWKKCPATAGRTGGGESHGDQQYQPSHEIRSSNARSGPGQNLCLFPCGVSADAIGIIEKIHKIRTVDRLDCDPAVDLPFPVVAIESFPVMSIQRRLRVPRLAYWRLPSFAGHSYIDLRSASVSPRYPSGSRLDRCHHTRVPMGGSDCYTLTEPCQPRTTPWPHP